MLFLGTIGITLRPWSSVYNAIRKSWVVAAMLSAVELRRRQGEIISQLMLVSFRAFGAAYARKDKHLDALMPELLTAMAIRKLARNGKSASVKAITTTTGFPLSNVRRHTIALLSMGLILRKDGGYIINTEYPGAGINARHVRIIIRAILAAAIALQKLTMSWLLVSILNKSTMFILNIAGEW